MDVQTALPVETAAPCAETEEYTSRLLASSGVPPLPPELLHLAPRPDEAALPVISDEEAQALSEEWTQGDSAQQYKIRGSFDIPRFPMRKAFLHLVPASPEPMVK